MTRKTPVKGAWRTRYRIAAAAALVAVALTVTIWRANRGAGEPDAETVEVVVPTFEEALEAPERLALVCRVLGQAPPPALENTDVEAARAIYNAIWSVASAPDDPSALGQLAMTYHAHEFDDQATHAYRRVIERDPGNYKWTYLAAYVSFSSNQAEDAIEGFKDTLELNPDYSMCYLNLGKLHHERGEDDLAEQAYGEFARRYPTLTLGHYGLAQVAHARGDLEGAEQHLRRALQCPEPDFRVHHLLGLTLGALGKPDQARLHTRKSRQMPQRFVMDDPLWAEVQELGRSLTAENRRFADAMDSGNTQAALDIIRRMAERAPDDLGVMINLAEVSRQLGEFAEAHKAAKRAIEINPKSAHAWTVLAAVRLDDADPQAAREAIDEAIRVGPQFAPAWNIRMSVYDRLRELDEAVASIEKATSLKPGHAGYAKSLALLLRRKGDRRAEIQALRHYIELNPGDSEMRHRLSSLESESPAAQ